MDIERGERMTEEIRETRLKVLEKDLASINNRLHHAFNQGFELGRKSTTPKEKTGHCKNCKYFEYDSVAKVNGIPLIVAHEICSRWGDGCKTKEDGYCFLFEPQESEE